jgi:hypothetical protein
MVATGMPPGQTRRKRRGLESPALEARAARHFGADCTVCARAAIRPPHARHSARAYCSRPALEARAARDFGVDARALARVVRGPADRGVDPRAADPTRAALLDLGLRACLASAAETPESREPQGSRMGKRGGIDAAAGLLGQQQGKM